MAPPKEKKKDMKTMEMESFCLLAALKLVPPKLCLGSWFPFLTDHKHLMGRFLKIQFPILPLEFIKEKLQSLVLI